MIAQNNWFSVQPLDGKTFAISEYGHVERVHSFLFLGEDKAALVDTGLGISNIKSVVDTLTALPTEVITTHAHWDHIGGHWYFQDIRIHKDDAGWLEQGIPFPEGEIQKALGEGSFAEGSPERFDVSKYIVYRGKPNKLVKDDEIIDLGNRYLQIIHTPGHSPGHICIYEERTGYLVTGDLFYKGILYCNFESTDPEEFLKSLNKIAGLQVRKILPGHNSFDIAPASIRSTRDFLAGLGKNGRLCHGVGLQGTGEIKIIL